MSLDFEITVFSDPQGEAAAKIYVVAVPTGDVSDKELAAFRLAGNIVGPTCKYSSTLQTKIPFRHRGFTQCGYRTALLAEATVPDPCYWSPELPFLYRAVGEVTGDATGAFAFEQIFGIRSIGTSRNRLTFNGQIWVPRGVRRQVVIDDAPLSAWRETQTAMVADDPAEEVCREADEAGVIIIARITSDYPASLVTLRRIGGHPSVAIAALGAMAFCYDGMTRQFARNTLLALVGDGGEGINVIAPEMHLFLMDLDRQTQNGAFRHAHAYPDVPHLFLLNTGKRKLTEARSECDSLQRDLVQRCDAAGYLV